MPISTPPSPAACVHHSRTRARFVCAARACSSSDRLTRISSIVSSTKRRKLKLGDPLDEKTEQGAIVSKTQLDKVKFYVDLAQKEGGKIALGGTAPKSHQRTLPRRLFLPADRHHRSAGLLPHKSRRNLRPGRHNHAVRQRRGSDRLRQRRRLRPGLERLDAKPEPRPSRRRTNPYRHSLGKLLARARSARPLRRHETKRRRPRRRRRSASILHRAKERLHREVEGQCEAKNSWLWRLASGDELDGFKPSSF